MIDYMTKIDDHTAARLRAFMAAPLAAVLPAEPGWRAIVQVGQELRAEPIAFWSVEPTMVLPKPVEVAAKESPIEFLMRSLFTGPDAGVERVRAPMMSMYPLDANRRRFDILTLHAWVGPDETDAEVFARVVEFAHQEAKRESEKAAREAKREAERATRQHPPVVVPTGSRKS